MSFSIRILLSLAALSMLSSGAYTAGLWLEEAMKAIKGKAKNLE